MAKGTRPEKPEIIPAPTPGLTDAQRKDYFRRFLRYALDLDEKPGSAGTHPAARRGG